MIMFNIIIIVILREAPPNQNTRSFGHCPFGGGGLNPCHYGLGHLFRGELSKFKWAFALFWGVKKLARMVWGTFFLEDFYRGTSLTHTFILQFQ